jgi:hypothetical protein
VASNVDDAPERFWETIEAEVMACTHLDAAAQVFCDRFYETFLDFAVLTRMFGTVPLGELPPADRAFAATFLDKGGTKPIFESQTPVLTLMGTRGVEPAWCARELSRDHRAIPLLSNDFIDGIPMIARLLGEIGFPRLSSSPAGWQFVTRDIVDVNGLFFVGDARTTTDERGRHIIPSFAFVERYGIKSVFGFGGPYSATSTFLTTIIFTRQLIPRNTAGRFVQLIAKFKAATVALVDARALFSAPASSA